MKTMTVFEARNNFSRTIEAAKHDVVVVTRNGRPVAAIQAIDDDDVEDLLLERSPKFWDMIRRARRGQPLSLSAARRRLGPRLRTGSSGGSTADRRRAAAGAARPRS